MPKFFGIKRHKIISPERIHHNEKGKERQVKNKIENHHAWSPLELLICNRKFGASSLASSCLKRYHSDIRYGNCFSASAPPANSFVPGSANDSRRCHPAGDPFYGAAFAGIGRRQFL